MSDIQLYDSQTSFQGGMQSGFDPAQVGEHQYFRGINVSCREGVIDPRPSFRKLDLDTSQLASGSEEYEDALNAFNSAQNDVDTAQEDVDDQSIVVVAKKALYDADYAIAGGDWNDLDDFIDASTVPYPSYMNFVLANYDQIRAYLYACHSNYALSPLQYSDTTLGGGVATDFTAIAYNPADQADVDALISTFNTRYNLNGGPSAAWEYSFVLYAAYVTDALDLLSKAYPVLASGYASEEYAITAWADNGSGKCRITTAAHTIPTDKYLCILGADESECNGIHLITAVGATTIDIDLDYTAAMGTQTNKGTDRYTLEYSDGWEAHLMIEALTATFPGLYDDWQTELTTLAGLQTILDDATDLRDQMQDILDGTFDGEWIFQNGRFQGMDSYNTKSKSYLVAVISGHIFLINLIEKTVSCLTTNATKLMQNVERCYLCQAEQYMIVQDGTSLPKILEGAELRDADPEEPEIPTGTNMAYGHGRLAIQVSARHFVMGDIFLAYEPENVLRMKESKFLNEGGGFTVSGRLGNIITLEYANVSDTSTGDGPLLAICDNGFSTFAVNNPRINWMDIGIQKVQLIGTGIVGSTAFCNINEDILYRSHEGIRSYAVGRREAASAYKYTELSREMEPYIQNDSGFDARFLSMCFFDKRMLSLTTPKTVKAYGTGYKEAKADFDAALDAALALIPDVTEYNAKSKTLAKLQEIFANATAWTPIAAPTREFLENATGETGYVFDAGSYDIPASFTFHMDFYFDEIDDSAVVDDSAIASHMSKYEGAGWNLGIAKSSDPEPFHIYCTFNNNAGSFGIDTTTDKLVTDSYNRVSVSYDAVTGDAILYINGIKHTANGLMDNVDDDDTPIHAKIFAGYQGGWTNKWIGVAYKAVYLDVAYDDAQLLALHNGLYPTENKIFDYEFGRNPDDESEVFDFSANQEHANFEGNGGIYNFSSETDPIYAKRLTSAVSNADEDEELDALLHLYSEAVPTVDADLIAEADLLIDLMTAVDDLYDEILDDVVYKAIIAFDFSLAGFTKSTSEDQYKRATTGSYDGIWTGLRNAQIVTTIVDGVKKCFSMTKLPDGTNGLYEITKIVSGYDDSQKIEQILELRAMPFKAEQTYVASPFVNKKLEDIILWLTGIEEDVDMEIQVTSDVVNAFTPIGTLNVKALTRSQTDPTTIGSPQSRAMFLLKDMQDLYDESTEPRHPIRQGNEFQFRLIWNGKVRLRRFFAAARKIDNVEGLPNTETQKKSYPIDTFDQYRYKCNG